MNINEEKVEEVVDHLEDDQKISDEVSEESSESIDDVNEVEEKELESEVDEQEDEGNNEVDSAEEDSEVVVSIGEDSPPQEETKKAPKWVKELRKSNRELKKQNRELQEKINSNTGQQKPKNIELGAKPKLEDCDYDSDKFEKELSDWFERKEEVDKQKSIARKEQEDQENQWKERLSFYEEKKNNLKVNDYEEAEFVAQDKLSQTQQGIIVQGSDNPALIIYALGKNPKKLEELSKIKDPVKFSFSVSKLETQLKITKRTKPESKPEKIIRGSGNSSGTVDSHLEKLREEAARTGDYTKVMSYKRQIKK